jgi:O-antigen/teichoic acid export membrane protein
LSTIQEDKARVRRSYLKAISLVAFITFPMTVGLFVVADHLILTLLGQKWAAVIPILRIMCGVGLVQSVGRWDWIYIPQGRTGLYFYMGVAVSAASAIAFLIGFQWGIIGMAWAYLICNVTIWYPTWALAGRVINLRFKDMIGAMAPVFACALSMGAIVFALRWLLSTAALPDWLDLAAEVAVGGLVYFSLVIGLRLKAWEEARLALGKMLGGRSDATRDLLLRLTPVSLRPRS